MRTFYNCLYFLYAKIGQLLLTFEVKSERAIEVRKKPVIPGMTLYHFQISPYSAKVRSAIYKMGLNIPFTDILVNHDACKDLKQKGGKDQVPCLRIDGTNGTQWMYESNDIIAYLKKVNLAAQ